MELLVLVGGAAGALLAIGALVRAVWRANRRLVVVVDAVQELVPNSGHSMKDQVSQTKTAVEDLAVTVAALSAQLAEHLADHCRGCPEHGLPRAGS